MYCTHSRLAPSHTSTCSTNEHKNSLSDVARCAATMFNGLVRPPCASSTPPARAATLRSRSRAHRGPRALHVCAETLGKSRAASSHRGRCRSRGMWPWAPCALRAPQRPAASTADLTIGPRLMSSGACSARAAREPDSGQHLVRGLGVASTPAHARSIGALIRNPAR